jgi:hypothetical protein
MKETKHPVWARHLDAIGDELLHLTIACDVNLRDPGVVERILKNDETVCGRKNPIGFRKLRDLLMATFSSVNKAIDRIGPDETKQIVDALLERLDRRREVGGTAKGSATRSSKPK